MRSAAQSASAVWAEADKPLGSEDLAFALGERRAEIEQTILARSQAIADPATVGDPAYLTGLRAAVSAALSYAISAIEKGMRHPDPVPTQLLLQARNAARHKVPLDVVLRRYVAGHAVLEEFIIRETRSAHGDASEYLQRALRAESLILDHLLNAVADEYRSEVEAQSLSRHRRRAELVRRLLAGKSADASELGYELSGWHLGAIVVGGDAQEAIRGLASALDRRLLYVNHEEETAWIWLGGSREFGPRQLERLRAWSWPDGVRIALGEPTQGTSGWRLTHRQAAAALPIAQHGEWPLVRYGEVALLASILQDEVLTASLRDLYLAPLADDRDDGATLRQTLRAYFAAERNVSSAAMKLGVDRKTVSGRLREIEQRLGRPLSECAAELEAALRLHEMGDVVAVASLMPPGH